LWNDLVFAASDGSIESLLVALAREDVGTFNIVINRHNAFASKPAPTESWSPQVILMCRIPCRSALAREEAGTSAIVIDRHNAFASKPAPTDVVCRR
jgi:hypothetical protein